MKKSELLNLPNEEKDLATLEEKIKQMRARLYSPKAAKYDSEIKGPAGKPGQLAETVIDLENELETRRAELAAKKETAGRIFKRLDDEHRHIMTLYYIAGLSWKSIAEYYCLSPASIYRKRNEALKELAKKPKQAKGV